MGSGQVIKDAIKKYGVENFTKEILFVFDNNEEASLKEKQLVDTTDPLSYNLMEGGRGGFDYIHKNCKHSWLGRSHTESHKKYMREINLGKNNPRYGVEVSEETKNKMKKIASKPKSEETKEKMRISALKRFGKL